MSSRRIKIVHTSDLTDPGELEGHRFVVKCWSLPRGFWLFEWYDPVFERTGRDPDVVSRIMEVNAEARRLLDPLFLEDGDLIGPPGFVWFGCETYYHLAGHRGKKASRWPQFGSSELWNLRNRIRISGRLARPGPQTIDALEAVFKEWSDCMVGLRQLTGRTALRFSDENFSSICEFVEPCGDATMALFMLLAATRKETTLGAVGFFYEDDYETPFRTHNGPGETKQHRTGGA
jgi:hypothetical protein